MTLNHLNLCVPDVAATRTFFETFFGFRCQDTKGAGALAILTDEAGFVLVLSNLSKASTTIYPDDFHIGFGLDSREQVVCLYERLKEGGVSVPHAPREMRGSLVFDCSAPGPVMVEISSRN